MRITLTGLWKHPDFIRLWSGQTISAFGSIAGGTAMSFTAILFLHATPLELGILHAMQLAPAILAGLIAGAWVDRLRRRPILIWVDIARAVLLATIPLAALFGRLHIVQLYIITFLVSILSITFDIAYQSYLPSLVGPEHIIEGNSKLTASAAVAEFGGFSLGGWMVQVFTAPLAVLVDAFSFIVSAVTLGWIEAREALAPVEEEANLRTEIVEGLRAVWRHPILRSSAAAILLHDLGSGAIGTLIALFSSQVLGLQPGVIGLIWAVGGVSSFLGAALTPRLTRLAGVGLAITGGLAVFGFSQLLIPLAGGAAFFAIACLVGQQLGDGFFVLYDINLVSLRQSLIPERMLGRVNATLRFSSLLATLAGALLGGWLGGILGMRVVLAAAAGCTLLGALVLEISPIRQIKKITHQPSA